MIYYPLGIDTVKMSAENITNAVSSIIFIKIAIMLILHNVCIACYINLNSTVFQEPCVTSTSTNAPSTRVTTGVHVLMASTASPACVQRATMMLPVCHKWMSVAATRASMAVARILSMGERRFRF